MERGHTVGDAISQLAILSLDHAEPPPGLHKTASVDVPGPSVSVRVTELSPLPPSSPTSPPPAETEPRAEPGCVPETAGLDTFACFPLLPAELRLKIWHLSFLPRTVELHTRRTHYADDEWHTGTPKWQSQTRNPAALSVSVEARAAALEHFTVALPLFAPPSRAQVPERPGDLLQDSDRVLYLNLAQDTVVLLGELHYTRLTRLLEWFRKMDGPARRRAGAAAASSSSSSSSAAASVAATKGNGLRRLAMSVAPWAHEVGAATLKAFARTVFADLDEFILFMCSERLPPPSWSGGRCLLQEALADVDYYRRFVIGRGRQFRVGDSWMVVGRRPMKVADISFEDGWC